MTYWQFISIPFSQQNLEGSLLMDFLFVVRNWVKAKAAGKLVNKQTVGEGVGGKSERILPFFFIMNFEIHCSHPLFFQFPYRQDQALTVTGSHFVIGFKCTEGAGLGVYRGARLGQAKSRRSCTENIGAVNSLTLKTIYFKYRFFSNVLLQWDGR